ncbi:MAG TPA: glycosyltransferase family 4 protein [Chloroflexia bacterium]|nr:glycosyltransferase family 4 protein [Chloroflexia bacterium]
MAGPGPDKKTTVLWIWHAAVVAEYRKPLAALARMYPCLDLTLLTPRRWPERAGQMVHSEPSPPGSGYRVLNGRTTLTGLYYLYYYPGLLSRLRRMRPDIVYCYEEAHTLLAAAVLLIRRLFLPRTRVLLYAAQNIVKRYPWPFRMFERYCFRYTDGILACGETVAATLRAKGYRGPLHVVALPTDVSTFTPGPELRARGRERLGLPDGALVVGYAGKLVEEKGIRTLLRAFARVARRHQDAHLVFAGGGPLKDEIARKAREIGLSGRVHLPGVIHNDDLPAYMNALDVFVLPSETRRNWREQFGRVVVEAMSCGVPVIGSDSGEIPVVLGGAGMVFREGQAGELAARLDALLSSPGERERLSRAGRERVLECFTTERVAEQHFAIYRSLLGEETSQAPEAVAVESGRAG